jgi:hypothetical protein
VDNIFDQSVKIKKDGERYIFNKFDKNIFAVNNHLQLE